MSPDSRAGSYNDILKATSIIGGSQAISYVIAMVRTKLVALLLGPSGVGIVGLFQSSTMLVGQITGFGIGSSGVRQIAEAHGSGDSEFTGKTVRVLRRVCWATGILGWVVTALLAKPLSLWAFDSPDEAWLIAILGASLLFTAVSSGQRSLLQGTRRIADIARINIYSSLAGTIVAVSIYAIFREQGIVPVLIVSAIINLCVSWWYARQITVPDSGKLTWQDTLREGKKLANLGFAFMWTGLLAALVDLGIRSMIVRESGLMGTGIYQAAWGMSGLFANFILTAMGTDFYPRLTAVTNDHKTMNSMVNEQIEIGNLIALPGLLGTLAFGPILLTIFYSEEFISGAELLPWFVFGIFCRVICWPLGFTMLAKGAARWFLVTETQFYVIHIVSVSILIGHLGMLGVGVGFVLAFIPAVIINLYVANRLIGFVCSRSACKLILFSTGIVILGFTSSALLPTMWNLMVGTALTLTAAAAGIRGIAKRAGSNHRIVRSVKRIPGMRFILGKRG